MSLQNIDAEFGNEHMYIIIMRFLISFHLLSFFYLVSLSYSI